jgi:hypothetical protein
MYIVNERPKIFFSAVQQCQGSDQVGAVSAIGGTRAHLMSTERTRRPEICLCLRVAGGVDAATSERGAGAPYDRAKADQLDRMTHA